MVVIKLEVIKLKKSISYRLLESLSCIALLGTTPLINADSPNVEYSKENTRITFDPSNRYVKAALNTVDNSKVKKVTLLTRGSSENNFSTNNMTKNRESNSYELKLKNIPEGTQYKYAVTFDDGKTFELNDPLTQNAQGNDYSVITSKKDADSPSSTSITITTPEGTKIEINESANTIDSDSKKEESITTSVISSSKLNESNSKTMSSSSSHSKASRDSSDISSSSSSVSLSSSSQTNNNMENVPAESVSNSRKTLNNPKSSQISKIDENDVEKVPSKETTNSHKSQDTSSTPVSSLKSSIVSSSSSSLTTTSGNNDTMPQTGERIARNLSYLGVLILTVTLGGVLKYKANKRKRN